jgi:hypothetical protein
MIERTEEGFGLKPERLAADTTYGSAANLNWLVNEKQIAPHIPVIDKSKRDDGTFSREDFTFDRTRNVYICPAFRILTTSQAHPQTRPPPAARTARCARRVHARCDRSEPTTSCQVRRPTAATANGVRCVSGVCVQCRCVDAEAPCERLGKPATAQWFSWRASHSLSPTFATRSAQRVHALGTRDHGRNCGCYGHGFERPKVSEGDRP